MDETRTPDRLWVPLLSHYREFGGRPAIDPDRMAAHIRFIRPNVGQFMLAGSTGDGWEFDRTMLMDVVALARRADLFDGARVLIGALRATTEEVVDEARAIEETLAAHGSTAGDYAGLVICPPIDAAADQERILDHYRQVLAATTSPIAVYELPQVTKCSIAPETMRTLAAEPRVTMFKDTSGADIVANAGVEGVFLVRGAEGGYVEALKPEGPYDGWLLSTGNAFGAVLRRIIMLHAAGNIARARRVSDVLTAVVGALFTEASALPFGNPFSNANRAVDHLWAWGGSWRDQRAPLTASGARLPPSLLEAAEDLVGRFPGLPEKGYLGG